jgi:hypothetical protein
MKRPQARQGCQIFLEHNIPKWVNIYQIATKVPNGHKMYQMAFIYSTWPYKFQPFPCQGPPKFTQIVFFGLKIYHLATLMLAREAFKDKQKREMVNFRQ